MSPNDNINTRRLTRELLLGIEHRGTDATGIAFLDSTNRFQIHKKDVAASRFVGRNLCMPKDTTTAILHTRMWTKGSPDVNANNHPIPQGHLVGVHNGWLTNYDKLWGEVVKSDRRIAEVDSEVIFAMLAHGLKDSGATTKDVLEAVKGNMAVAWLDRDAPRTLQLARGHSSPLWVGQTENGSTLFASEKEVVIAGAHSAHMELAHLREIAEGNLLTVINGDITDITTFKPEGPTYAATARRVYDSWDDYDYMRPKSAKASARTFVMGARGTTTEVEAISETPVNIPTCPRRLFDMEYSPDQTVLAADYSLTEHREMQIDEWFSNFKGAGETLSHAATRLKALCFPGDLMETQLAGEKVSCQVLEVPDRFPGGRYVLRAFVPTNRTIGRVVQYEAVIIERMWHEFNEIAAPATTSVLSV